MTDISEPTEILFTYYEPMLNKEIEVTYDMLSVQGKRHWDSGAIKNNWVRSVSLKVETEPEPAIQKVIEEIEVSDV